MFIFTLNLANHGLTLLKTSYTTVSSIDLSSTEAPPSCRHLSVLLQPHIAILSPGIAPGVSDLPGSSIKSRNGHCVISSVVLTGRGAEGEDSSFVEEESVAVRVNPDCKSDFRRSNVVLNFSVAHGVEVLVDSA